MFNPDMLIWLGLYGIYWTIHQKEEGNIGILKLNMIDKNLLYNYILLYNNISSFNINIFAIYIKLKQLVI